MRVTEVSAVLLALVVVTACRTVPMPDVAEIRATGDLDSTRAAIEDGIRTAGWEIEGAGEDWIDAVLRSGGHLAAVRISYGASSVSIHYLRSDNLNCWEAGDSCSRIHRAYRSWVTGLRAHIAFRLAPPPTINEYRYDSKVEIGTSGPGSGYEEVGAVIAIHGAGCGVFGYRGSYEGAIEILRREAVRKGADYIQIIRISAPHAATAQCFDNRYQIDGLGFRLAEKPKEASESAEVSGTCFSVSPSGLVLTSYHVVRDAKTITVRFDDGTEFGAEVEAASFKSDLAVLRLESPYRAYLTISEKPARVGERVFAMGYPAQSLLGGGVKYSEGSISSVSGEGFGDARLMQISVPIQPGSSGSPLVRADGSVVGVVVATAAVEVFFKATGNIPQNVNFAVRTDAARHLFPTPPSLGSAASREAAIARVSKATCAVFARGS